MKRFNVLYNQHYKSVYRLAFRFLNNHENAADISQDVFVYLYKRLVKSENIENEKSWLFKVTCNLSLAYLKKNRRLTQLNNDTLKSVEVETDSNTEIITALEKLKEDDRILLTLYNEGLSYKELAATTGIKYTSVGKTLSRALKRLKDELAKK